MNLTRSLAVALALLAVAPAALAVQAEGPVGNELVAPAPPDGLGTSDPWVDAQGDSMTGTLDMGASAVRFLGRDLRASPTNGSLLYAGQRVCVQGDTVCAAAVTYTGTSPIGVSGSSISLLATGCAAGEVWKWTGAAWDCSPDLAPSYLAGTGLTLTGTTFSADTNVVQRRVASTCAVGGAIRAIAADGTVTCETDDNAVYTAGAGIGIASNVVSADTGYLQRRVSTACAAGSAIRSIATDGTIGCETDDSASYAAGTGLSLAGTTFSADASYLQRRVAASCGVQGIASVAQDGTVACSRAWTMAGNSGTTSADFLGTVDNKPFEIRVWNDTVVRYLPASNLAPTIIAGWEGNTVASGVVSASILGGGDVSNPQHVHDDYGTIGGGRGNVAGDPGASSAWFATVGGGSGNTAFGSMSVVSGGGGNNASGARSAILGGTGNTALGDDGIVVGGAANRAYDSHSIVVGGYSNKAGRPDAVSNGYSVVAGGSRNAAWGSWSVAGGGIDNNASGHFSVAAGGQDNLATADHAVVGGGWNNDAVGAYATVAGGRQITAEGRHAAVAGGSFNRAWGVSSAIGGGDGNVALGQNATVPGGYGNNASGDFSFAAGRFALAAHRGAFVWGDSQAATFDSSATDTFNVRAANGVYLGTGGTATVIPSGRFLQTSTGAYLSSGGSWVSTSDRAMKENFAAIDAREVLAKVRALPITMWNYIAEDDGTRHLGPMAQDFHAAFGLGDDDKHIAAVDETGVALAAIQGLALELEERDARIADLEARLARMEALLAR